MADPEIVEDSKSKGKKQPDKEAAAPAGDGKEKAAAKKGLPLNPMMIIGVFSVVLAIGAAFLLVLMLAPAKPAAPKTESAAAGEDSKDAPKDAGDEAGKKAKSGEKKHGEKKKGHGKEGESPDSPFFSFEKPFVVNLADTNGERYLKVDMSFQMSAPDVSEELQAKKVQVMDLLITILSRKNLEAVSTTVGKNMLKEEMLEKINAQLETGSLTNIYFTEFVVQ